MKQEKEGPYYVCARATCTEDGGENFDYFVHMSQNFFCELFCNTYVGGVAQLLQYPFPRSHTKTKNVTCCNTQVLGLYPTISCSQARFLSWLTTPHSPPFGNNVKKIIIIF